MIPYVSGKMGTSFRILYIERSSFIMFRAEEQGGQAPQGEGEKEKETEREKERGGEAHKHRKQTLRRRCTPQCTGDEAPLLL